MDEATVADRLADVGPDARYAVALDERVGLRLPAITALSELTSALVVSYVERVARPVAAMSPAAGARIMARGYVAHVVVEEDPALVGADDVPVLGDLPALNRRGRPPQDLLMRVIKASRRHFVILCALSPEAWEAFVVVSRAHVHDEADLDAAAQGGDEGAGPAYLGEELVDGLLRAGWLLRQVDLAYGLEPEWSTE